MLAWIDEKEQIEKSQVFSLSKRVKILSQKTE